MVKKCDICGHIYENVTFSYNKDGTKAYKTEDGAKFKGKRCPICQKAHHKMYMQRKRKRLSSNLDRYCHFCGKKFVPTAPGQHFHGEKCRISDYYFRSKEKDKK
jgi:hypothetical protein